MLTITSRTFNAGGKRVTVRAVQPQKPGGLANIGWRWPGYDVNVTIDGNKYLRVGGLMVRVNGNFAWSLGSMEPYVPNPMNTLNAYDCGKYGCTPHSYKTADFALNHLADFIKCSIEGTVWTP